MATKNCVLAIHRLRSLPILTVSSSQYHSFSYVKPKVGLSSKILLHQNSSFINGCSQLRWLSVSNRRQVADKEDEEELLKLLGVSNKTDPSSSSSIGTDVVNNTSDVSSVIPGTNIYNPNNWGADGLEYLHSYGFSWSLIILGSTAFVRLLTSFLYVKSEQDGARHLNNLLTTVEWDRKLKEAMKSADPVSIQQVNTQYHEYAKEKKLTTMESQIGQALIRFSIIGLQLGVVHQLVARNSAGLTYEGLLWLTDLTVVDPTMVLPAAITLASYIWFIMKYEYSMDYQPVYLWTQRAVVGFVSIPLFLVYSSFSSAFLLCLGANLSISLAFMTLFRQPIVRKVFRIDQINTKPDMKQLWQTSGSLSEFINRRYDAKHGYIAAKKKLGRKSLNETMMHLYKKWTSKDKETSVVQGSEKKLP